MPRLAGCSAGSDSHCRLPEWTNQTTEIFRQAFRRLKPRTELPVFDVRYRHYAKLKSAIRFEPTTGTVHADLSDLLRQAPLDVIQALATILLARLYCKRIAKGVHDDYNRWVYTPEVQQRILEIRRDRGRKRLLPAAGAVYDLNAVFDCLNTAYFAARLHRPMLGWSPRSSRSRLGHFDPAHDVIVISRVLDSPAVPRLALEYVLYHEMLHVKHPVQLLEAARCVHPPAFLADERRFSGLERAQRMLRSL